METREPPKIGLDSLSQFDRRNALTLIGASLATSCAPNGPAPQRDPELRYSVDDSAAVRLLARLHDGRTLLRAAVRRATLKASTSTNSIAPVVVFNTLVVFDRDDLEGGGLTFGQDFNRTLLELGLGRCERLFEFCAGPAYIGYSLLANGFCERLTLADINPVSVEAARKTAEFNNIQHLVNTYVSDSLKQIPDSERWDLVVGNPPHFRGITAAIGAAARPLIWADPEWSLHRDFYTIGLSSNS
jgi:Methyltransferase small domain